MARNGSCSDAEQSLLDWTRESAETGLALVSAAGSIHASNERLASLSRSQGTWRWLSGPHANVRYGSFEELLRAEVAALPAEGRATARFERHAQVVELRLERLRESVAVVVHDVTRQLSAQISNQHDREVMLHDDRMLAMGVLASGVAHDLNHALNVISLRVATLRANPQLSPVSETLDALVRVVGEAASTVARLQDLARRRRDRPAGRVDLAAVLTATIKIARTELAEGPVRIDAEVPRLPLVRGAAAEVGYVFMNMLLRARAAMPLGGTVRVRAREQAGFVAVTFADEGAEIPQDELAHAFDPFFQGSEVAEAQTHSLGLSIACGVMSRLGGSISVASAGGTTFTFTFPVAVSPAARERSQYQLAARERSQAQPAARRGLRVLLVDDEPDNLEVLRELLEMEGHHVDAARTGREAVAWVGRGARYDLVLCDVGMPEMSGWQVAREIQAIAPGTRIYMLTGWAAEIGASDPRRRHVLGVLAKPLDLRELKAVLGGSGTVELAAPH